MNATNLDMDVAVVGTGVVGLAAALGLAQLGVKVALIGPHAITKSGGATSADAPFDARIYALSPGSVKLLKQLNVWPQIDATRCTAVTCMRVFGDAGDELTLDAYSAAIERLATIVEELELVRMLESAAAFSASIKRIAVALVAAKAHEDHVELQLADSSVLRAALVLGADGAQSAVRAAAGITAQSKLYQQTAIVANFACEKPHLGVAYQWFTDEGVLALLPLPGAHVSLVWSAPDALAVELSALDMPALAARVAAISNFVLGKLRPAGNARSFPLRMISVNKLTAPRTVLVGDAAHVVHPLAGQGLNLGLQDVAQLLQIVSERESFRELGDAVLLRRYERARAADIGLMRATTDSLARLFAVDNSLIRRGRNLGLRAVNSISPLKAALIRHALG